LKRVTLIQRKIEKSYIQRKIKIKRTVNPSTRGCA